MRSWLLLLGGLIVWAAHFFMLYGIASIWPGDPVARLLTGAVTLVAVAADAFLLRLVVHDRKRDELDQWVREVAIAGAAISLVAVLWQGLPAIAG